MNLDSLEQDAMVNTITRSIDFKGLAQGLYRHLQSDAIIFELLAASSNPSESVDCLLEDEILRVIIHLVAPPSLETNAIFSSTREFLEQAGVMACYEVKIHLVVDEETASIPANKMLLAPLRADFPKRPLAKGEVPSQIKTDWTNLSHNSSFFLEGGIKSFSRVPGIGIGLGLLLLGSYALTRPCVLGECPSINRAEQLTQSALLSLNTNETMDWLTIQQQLKEAIQILEPIPPWSRFHAQTTQLITDYKIRLQTVEILNQAVRQTQQAQGLIQRTTISLSESNQAISLLQEVIVSLKEIPQTDADSHFVKKQLRSAQLLLVTAQQRLLVERQAKEKFDRATENVVLAKIRGTNPQSLADLNLIAATWQSVIHDLQQIAPNTTLYDKAKRELSVYNQAYKVIEARKRRENLAQLNYQEAIALSQIAEKASLENQFSVAAVQWQKAIAALKSIPADSFLGEQSRLLLTTYNLSLQEVQDRLKNTLRSQNIKQLLDSVCLQWIRACDYSIGRQVIKVRLTPDYVKQIWDSALQAKTQGNVVNQTGVLNHIAHLEQALQNISNQSGLPLELYHAKGNRLTVYQPNA